MGETSIQWTDYSWNPIGGCTAISPGCGNCYAALLTSSPKLKNHPKYRGLAYRNEIDLAIFTGEVRTWEKALKDPFTVLPKMKRNMVFVCSMSDLFHAHVPIDFIDKVFAVMAVCHKDTFQVLTKRTDRMFAYLSDPLLEERLRNQVAAWLVGEKEGFFGNYWPRAQGVRWELPLKNVWVGTSVESQKWADWRMPYLEQCPAALRFVSHEPALQLVDFSPWIGPASPNLIHWLIMGGETGTRARAFDLNWARRVSKLCEKGGVKFFLKAVGCMPYDSKTERDLTLKIKAKRGDKVEQWPKELQRREMPVPVCELCDGDGSLMYQMAKEEMVRTGGKRRLFSDGRKGFYYVNGDGQEIEMKTIGGNCGGCGGVK